jgi:spoIIIJ-associated protein
VTSDKLDYEVIEKGSAGFFGIGAKPAVIRARRKQGTEDIMKEFSSISDEVSPKAVEQDILREEEKTPEAPKVNKPETPVEKKAAPVEKKADETPVKKESSAVSAAPAEGQKEAPKAEKPERRRGPKPSEETEKKPEEEKKPPKPIENPDEVQAKVREFLGNVFQSMNLNVTIETSVNQEEREVAANLSGDDMGVLIGKRGQTLDSLQYLASLVVNRHEDDYIRVRLDTENYRERRKETLETLARNIAYKVKRTRRPVALEPMNPYERRIIHSALQGDRYVLTKSEGEDPYRHVIIYLKKDKNGAEYSGRPGRAHGRGRYEDPDRRGRRKKPVEGEMPAVKQTEEKTAALKEEPSVPKWKEDSHRYGNSVSISIPKDDESGLTR